ncbi:50S ribosomal protein L25 [Clostridium formicaceticum]|uniref:Large ribosomal subunit protein bL25 n=1 Tax=Clostridium formicaceticum TaxID=1497 RepID=A0AAC9WEF8_9CLOT|nr:50S ribosomal protein L25 [Clostridium formicaceticum]AOY75441.1 hypothetical protein BJL90_05750 [Clostridium formicaceticum]ARE85726.1 General stress protein CTC [Clostridium formicaceticum]
MSTPMLKVNLREATGKNKMSKDRKQGSIPGVVYCKGQGTKLIYLNAKEMEKLLSHYGIGTKISLDFEGEKTYAIIKEIQKNTLKNNLLHVDLQTLDDNEKIKLTMPIYILNKEKVESSSEILQTQLSEVEIQTYPKYIPEKIEIDALKIKEKDHLTIADLNIATNENIEILNDRNSIIAAMVYASKMQEADETVEENSL